MNRIIKPKQQDFPGKEAVVVPIGKNRDLLDFIFVILGKFSMIAVILLGGILIARTGGPAEYGIFILIISSALLIDGVLGTSLDLSVIRYSSSSPEVSRSSVVSSQAFAFHLKWAAVGILLILYLILGPLAGIQRIIDYPVLSILLVGLGLLVSRSVLVDAQIRKKFRLYSSIDALQGVGRMIVFALLAWMGCSQAVYYSGAYGGTGILVLLGGVFFLKQKFVTAPLPPRKAMLDLFHFAGAMTFIIACGTLTGRGDVILLSFVQSNESLAHYGAASQIAQLLTQIALYASVLTQPRILQDLREGSIGKLLSVNVAAVSVIAVVSAGLWKWGFFDWGIRLLFGDGFTPSIPLLRIQYIGGILDLLLVPVLVTLSVLTAPKWCAWGELCITVLFFTAGFLIITHLGTTQAQVAMSWTFVGVRILKLLFYMLLYLKISLNQRTAMQRNTRVEAGNSG